MRRAGETVESVAVTLINLFEVPPDADEAFIAGWERTRDFLAAREGYVATALHRSLVPEADFRFVNVSPLGSADEWRAAVADPAFPGREMPFTAHPALYEVAAEDPPPEDESGGVVLINAFEVPAGEDPAFVPGWERARDALRGQRGYLGTRLYRSLQRDADFRFVHVAPWESVEAFGAALGRPEFRAAAQAMSHRAHPALYEVVRR